jgi:hypothetical protein
VGKDCKQDTQVKVPAKKDLTDASVREPPGDLRCTTTADGAPAGAAAGAGGATLASAVATNLASRAGLARRTGSLQSSMISMGRSGVSGPGAAANVDSLGGEAATAAASRFCEASATPASTTGTMRAVAVFPALGGGSALRAWVHVRRNGWSV